jgi:peptidyl-tRNA hydrolase
MQDYNSPEAVAARKDQTDPIIMYLIVRESLNMSIGKTAAQVGHAVQMLQLGYQKDLDILENTFDGDIPDESSSILQRVPIYKKWLETSFRKIVLKADEKEFAKILKEMPNNIVLVTDAGLTELAPQTDTVIGVFPMYKSECPKLIKRLQVLK